MDMNKLEYEERQAKTQCPWCKSRNAVMMNGTFYCSRCGYEKDVSAPEKIKVVGWTTGDDSDYLEYECETTAIYNAIVAAIKENGYSFSWLAHQSNQLPCTPIINNGYRIHCGPRTWGAIMAEAHGADESDDCAYAEYAFGVVDDPVYPKKHVDLDLIVPFEIETAQND